MLAANQHMIVGGRLTEMAGACDPRVQGVYGPVAVFRTGMCAEVLKSGPVGHGVDSTG